MKAATPNSHRRIVNMRYRLVFGRKIVRLEYWPSVETKEAQDYAPDSRGVASMLPTYHTR